MFKPISNIYLIIVILLLFSCNNDNLRNQIVLKIADLEITKYEFEKSRKNAFTDNKNDIGEKIKLNKQSEWKKQYLAKYTIIAHAYKLGYDTISEIQKQVEFMSNFMIVQQYGYLWKATVSPIVDEFKQVTKVKEQKRKKLFYFDYIICNEINDLLEATNGDTIIENLNEYNKLKNKCHLYESLHSGYISQKWPFISFWKYREYLYKMNNGEVSELMKIDDSYVYVYLDYTEDIEITDNEKSNLQTELQLGIEQEIDDKKTVEITEYCKPSFNNKNIEELTTFLEKDKFENYLKNPVLLEYYISDTLKKLDFLSLLEYNSYLPVKNVVNTNAKLLELINQYYYDDYLKWEAKKIGIFNSDTFLLDRKMFKNGIIYDKYIEDCIINKIQVDSSEILQYYSINKSNYTIPKYIFVNMFTFNNEQAALNNIHKISEYIINNQSDSIFDFTVFNGLCDYKNNLKIDIEENNFSNDFINRLINQQVSKLTDQPLIYQNKAVLIYKIKTEGQCVKKLELVYDEIKQKIDQEKIELKTQELLSELKQKYKIEIDKTGIN